ncbi:MAG: DNA-processing protein DprA, partial [Bacteroidota bacterium]
LEKIPDVGPVTAEAIKKFHDFEKAENECRFIEKHNITPLFYLDKSYPARLKNCSDAPVMLYYKGNADLNSQRIVAIVGSRSATDYGKTITEKIVADLKPSKVIIASGLAYGIDVYAHKAALKNEMETVGVLAHGLDRIYPGLHRSIAEKMIERGGLLTEYLTETNPDKENFPQRNRIVAGISDAVVVIEAAKKGGALITAEIADNYNRDVFAVPGRLNDSLSEGCNHLIKINKAALIESAKDIEYIMGWEEKQSKKIKNVQRNLFIELNAEEKSLIDFISLNGSMNIDAICSNMTLPVSKVSATLLNLEFKGMLKSLPGKIYELI